MGRLVAMTAATVLGFALVACTQQQGQMASAGGVTYTAHLTGQDEVPPTTSTGTGDAKLTYDTTSKVLSWTVTYSGLSGPATAAHIHGPAVAGANAGVVIPFDNVPKAPAGTITGSKAITDAQYADLNSGRYYINIHTERNKGGEIRGQIARQ